MRACVRPPQNCVHLDTRNSRGRPAQLCPRLLLLRCHFAGDAPARRGPTASSDDRGHAAHVREIEAGGAQVASARLSRCCVASSTEPRQVLSASIAPSGQSPSPPAASRPRRAPRCPARCRDSSRSRPGRAAPTGGLPSTVRDCVPACHRRRRRRHAPPLRDSLAGSAWRARARRPA